MFDPIIQRIREMGSPGLLMSGSRDEGPLLGSVKPAAQPPGRGFFVERRTGSKLVQVALMEDDAAPAAPAAGAHHAGQPAPQRSGGSHRAPGPEYSGLPATPHRRI
jgi:hypothetical protein